MSLSGNARAARLKQTDDSRRNFVLPISDNFESTRWRPIARKDRTISEEFRVLPEEIRRPSAATTPPLLCHRVARLE
jgi:hypothetical protein